MLSKLELEDQIRKARKEYWEDADPSISDSKYDQLLIDLETVDPTNGLLMDVESKPIDPSLKVKHPVQLLSLNKVYSPAEVFTWMNKVARSPSEKFVISPKYDGMACRFYTKTNILATRGEGGIEGENITSKIPLITNINFNNQNNDIAGELLCTEENFKKCTAIRSNGKPYATERNLATGVINNKSIDQFIGKVELTLVPYDSNVYVRGLDVLDGKELNLIINALLKIGYPTDGVVISLEDSVYAESLGVTSHHPKHSVALKFPDEEKQAKLLDVIFQVGKNKITPVASIEPTMVDGALVKRISMHNVKFCLDNDIQIGDTLVIKRAGRVIPNIIRSIPGKERKIISITECPECGGAIEYNEPFLYCLSHDCSGSTKKKMQYAAKVLGLDVLGPGTIDKCVDTYGCENLPDLLELTHGDFFNLEGFAAQSAFNAVEAIRILVNTPQPDYKILASIATPGLGRGIWKKLLIEYTVEELCSMELYEFISIKDIGGERANQIWHTLNDSKSVETLNNMYSLFTIESTKGSISENKTVCFSGKFPFPKKHYVDLARNKGYDTVTSVTKNLDLLVNNGAITSKVSKARSYGVRVVDLDVFTNL